MKFTLPFDKTIEQYILGCCANAEELNPELKEEYFHVEAHKNIFKAFSEGVFFPSETSSKKYNVSMEIFLEVIEASGTSFYARGQYESLKSLSARRQLIVDSYQSIIKAQDMTVADSELKIDITEESGIVDDNDLCEDVAKKWDNAKPIKTGFESLDYHIGAFDPGDVWYLAGRSGTKKTALSMQLLENLCQNEGCRGIFFSLEMGKMQFFKRLVFGLFYKLNGHLWCEGRFENARIQASNWFRENKSIQLAHQVTPKNYSICWDGSLNIDKIASYVRKERSKGNNVKTIAIDYFQLIGGDGPTRREIVAANARNLKLMAKKEEIKVIALTQLSRLGEDGTIKPKLHHLKETGDIEEAADIVTGSWLGFDESHINITTLKNRNDGVPGDFVMMTDGVYFRDPMEQEISYITGQ